MKTFAFLVALTVPAFAADDYELRMSRPAKVGDREQKTGKFSEVSKMVILVADKPIKSEQTEINIEYTAEAEVLEVGPNGKPTSRRLKLTKFAGDLNGKPATQLAAGDEIVVTRKAGGPEGKEMTVNKTPATREQAKLISGFVGVGAAGETTDDEVFGTEKRIKAGDEWKVNPEKAAKQMGETGFTGLDPAGVKGSAKFIGVSPIEGMPCLHVRGVYEIKGSGMGLPNVPPGVKVSKLVSKVQTEGYFPVDVNEAIFPSNTVLLELEMTAGGEIDDKGQKLMVQVTAAGKKARTETCKRIK
jgi:hypothetical protein